MSKRARIPSKPARPAQKESRVKEWLTRVKENPAIVITGAVLGLLGLLASRITDVQKISAYVAEWRNYSRLVRPYAKPLQPEEVSKWSSGQAQLAILQIQGYLGQFKSGPRSVQFCLAEPNAFPNSAATQLNTWGDLEGNDVDRSNLKLLNDQLERLDGTRFEEERFLPIASLYARLLARGSTQLFYGNAFRNWVAEFDAVPKESLYFLRNGLYARHGRPFSGARTRRFFNRRSWYSVDPNFTDAKLNAVEICNAYFLKERYPGLPVSSWGRGIRLVLDPQPPIRDMSDLLCHQLDSVSVGIECYVRSDLSSEELQRDFTDFELQVGVGEETSVAITTPDAATGPLESGPVDRQIRVSARSVAGAIAAAGLGTVAEISQYRRGYFSMRVSLGPAAINSLHKQPDSLAKVVPYMVAAIKDIFASLDTSLYDPVTGNTGSGPSDARDQSRRAPMIISKPLPFDQERRDLALEYVRRHYGISLDAPYIVPRIIVLHGAGVDDLEGSFQKLKQSMLPKEHTDLKRSGELNVSAHFLIDRDGAIYELLPETALARHAIGLNLEAIGIENVGGTAAAPLTAKQVAADAALIRVLVSRHPIEWLVGHYETKQFRGTLLWRETDPGYLTNESDPDKAFMRQVRAMVSDLGLKGAPPKSQP